MKRDAPLLKGLPTLPTPQVTQQLGSRLCGAATLDTYAGRHDRPTADSSRPDDFSAFLRIIEDDCHSGQVRPPDGLVLRIELEGRYGRYLPGITRWG